jgi:hypothetical protein
MAYGIDDDSKGELSQTQAKMKRTKTERKRESNRCTHCGAGPLCNPAFVNCVNIDQLLFPVAPR